METIDFSKQLFRCSKIGSFMTNDRTGKKMGQTAKKELDKLFLKEVKGVEEAEVHSKQMEKGNFCEEESLTLFSEWKGKLLFKNKELFSNEFVKGTPDIVEEIEIDDLKTSWDALTFIEADGSNKDYYYQGLGYCWLTGKRKFNLVYCLVNTPDWLISAEERKIAYSLGVIDPTEGINEQFDSEIKKLQTRVNFDNWETFERLKVFQWDWTEKEELFQIEILKIKKRLEECREYLIQKHENYLLSKKTKSVFLQKQ